MIKTAVELDLPIRVDLNADVTEKKRSDVMKTKALKLWRYEESQMINISIFSHGDIIPVQQEALMKKYMEEGMEKWPALKKSQEIVEGFFRACERCSKNGKAPFRLHITEFKDDPKSTRNKIRFPITEEDFIDGKYVKEIETKTYGKIKFKLERYKNEEYVSNSSSIVAEIEWLTDIPTKIWKNKTSSGDYSYNGKSSDNVCRVRVWPVISDNKVNSYDVLIMEAVKFLETKNTF